MEQPQLAQHYSQPLLCRSTSPHRQSVEATLPTPTHHMIAQAYPIAGFTGSLYRSALGYPYGEGKGPGTEKDAGKKNVLWLGKHNLHSEHLFHFENQEQSKQRHKHRWQRKIHSHHIQSKIHTHKIEFLELNRQHISQFEC